MKKHCRSIAAIIILLYAVSNYPCRAYAQPDASRATSEMDRFRSREMERKLQKIPPKTPEPTVKEAPVVKDERKFFVKKIILVGCETFPPETFATLLAKYENREIGFSELANLAGEIGRDYLDRGIIAAVFAPPQDVVEQMVTLRVVEARMGEIVVQKHKYFDNKMLKKYWIVPPGEILQYGKLSKSLQMMNKNPDREVKAGLRAGKKPGTTDVYLTPDTRFPIHTIYSFDNDGVLTTGKYRNGFAIRDNNLLGVDDIGLGGFSLGQDFKGAYGYHNVPLGSRGTALIYGYSYSESTPKGDFTQYGMKSTAETYSGSIHQDIYWDNEYVGEIFSGFDAKDKLVNYQDGVLNKDRLRVMSFGGTYVKRSPDGVVYISPIFSQGLNAFGASSPTNPLASNSAASTFSKFNVDFSIRTALPFDMQENLKIRTQFAGEKLFPQEEFALGGIDSVRGYPASDYLADNAVLTNLEILIPAIFIPKDLRLPYDRRTLRDNVTMVTFMDWGYGNRRVDEKSHNMIGIGGGLRFNIYDQAVVRLEWGVPIGDRPITESYPVRFHFAIDFQDKLPEEIQRITTAMRLERIEKKTKKRVDQELTANDNSLKREIEGYRLAAEEASRKGDKAEAERLSAKAQEVYDALYNKTEEEVRAEMESKKK